MSSNTQGVGRGLKAAVKAFGRTPIHFSAAGKQVICGHCGSAEFGSREVLLNTRGATFFNFDWLNHSATVLTCKKCSHIEWFNETPELLD